MRDKHGICLLAYVIMPEHVHVLLYPQQRASNHTAPISSLLAEFKQYVRFHGKEVLREYWRRRGGLWSEALNAWARGELPSQEFWTTRAHDFNTYDRERVYEKVEYSHNNPVNRGLVRKALDWRWSSYRFYEVGDTSLIAMDWDGKWPLEW